MYFIFSPVQTFSGFGVEADSAVFCDLHALETSGKNNSLYSCPSVFFSTRRPLIDIILWTTPLNPTECTTWNWSSVSALPGLILTSMSAHKDLILTSMSALLDLILTSMSALYVSTLCQHCMSALSQLTIYGSGVVSWTLTFCWHKFKFLITGVFRVRVL